MKKETDKGHIGSLIRNMRKAAGLSQMALAERVGVSYQQIQKYEKGASEISITRLAQIADALNTPVNTFISGDEPVVSESKSLYGALSDDEIELLKLFRKIKNKKLKDGFLIAVKGIAGMLEQRDTKKAKS